MGRCLIFGFLIAGTTEAHYEKPVPESVLKGIRLLEEAESHLINGSNSGAKSRRSASRRSARAWNLQIPR
jgi:hypothetical protein